MLQREVQKTMGMQHGGSIPGLIERHLNQDLAENLDLFCEKEDQNLPGRGLENARSLKEKAGMSRNVAELRTEGKKRGTR